MPNDRGSGQYLPDVVATETRARYEAHQSLEINDYLYGGLLSSGSLIEDLSKNTSTDVLFQNDANSNTYYNVGIQYITNGRSTGQLFLNVAVNSEGQELKIGQQRSDFKNNVGNLTATRDADVDVTNARTFPERLLSTSRRQGEIVESESVLIAPGDNLCVVVNNIDNNEIDVTIYLEISPIPGELISTITDGPTK